MPGAGPRTASSLGLPEQVRACLFDLDGVLTETAKVHAAAWKEMFDAFLKARADKGGEPFVAFDEADYDSYVDGKTRADGTRSFLGSVRYLRAVVSAGLRRAVVSSSANCAAVLEAAGIAELFDVRIDGVSVEEDHLAGKPAPDTFLAAARALGTAPGEAAVFEDALSGVQAGRAGGFGFVVGVDRAGQAEALRAHGADIVVNDLVELLERP